MILAVPAAIAVPTPVPGSPWSERVPGHGGRVAGGLPARRRARSLLAWTLSAVTASGCGTGSLPPCTASLFGAPSPLFLGASLSAVVTADFNGDGQLDLAVADVGFNSIAIYTGDGKGNFTGPTNVAAGTSPLGLAVADFNGDGHPDLAVANRDSNDVVVLLGNGTGGFGAPRTLAAGTGPVALVAVDVNGDGKPDLVVANVESNDISILLGDGQGGFSAPVSVPVGTGPLSIATADFNGDKRPDLAVGTSSGVVYVLLGNGAGGFDAPRAFPVNALTTPARHSVAIGDLNGDGKLDLVVANEDTDSVSLFLGDGVGGFSPRTDFGSGPRPEAVVLADFNGDGKLDMAVANDTSGAVSILLGNGDGSFKPAAAYPAGSSPTAVVAGDFNDDGKPDLAVANGSGDIDVMVNTQGTPCSSVSLDPRGPVGGVPGVFERPKGAPAMAAAERHPGEPWARDRAPAARRGARGPGFVA